MNADSAVKVSIYARLSLDLHGTELGVERQEKECREYAEARGWTVAQVFVDNDLSATTGVERPAFERLLASRPQAILCWHLDRLLRISGDLERVIELGVDVFSKEAGWFDLSNPAGRAVARTVTAWSTYEGEQKAVRQKAAHRQRVEERGGLTATGRPWWPTRPLGFNLDGSHHEVEAPALRQVYSDLLKGGTLAAAVRYLESCGIVTQRSLDLDAKKAAQEGRRPVGKPWKASSLRPALLNPRNAGIYQYTERRRSPSGGYEEVKTEVGRAGWEPIVHEDVFRAVARILTDPSRRRHDGEVKVGFGHRENLLTGLARCIKCEHTVRAAWRRNARGERTYKVYQCGGCHGTTLPAAWADSVVGVQILFRAEQWKEALNPSAQGDVDLAALRNDEAALIARKGELAEMYVEGLVDRKALVAGLAQADRRLTEITDALADHALHSADLVHDIEHLADWATDDAGWDVNKFRPVVERMCAAIWFVGPGKGRSRETLRKHENIKIEWRAAQ
ncbi:recombinase family protein [Nocardioides nitrophenolicus]|uniref:recombinase family protein n=1 Tax=Nocardioides nitrophenolicus TaxID=60489 RepID=UPI0019590E6E|nr:recombinase family protein [Nocardioides nitrophenolicus]MBM7519502.1 DNA invertase Pin-like site-specific DNA recombinase [Nocardioides nitrophenolicus]